MNSETLGDMWLDENSRDPAAWPGFDKPPERVSGPALSELAVETKPEASQVPSQREDIRAAAWETRVPGRLLKREIAYRRTRRAPDVFAIRQTIEIGNVKFAAIVVGEVGREGESEERKASVERPGQCTRVKLRDVGG